jgi:hypothetical protein
MLVGGQQHEHVSISPPPLMAYKSYAWVPESSLVSFGVWMTTQLKD